MEDMDKSEKMNLILGLRELGFTEKDINDFTLYLESGDKNYLDKVTKVSPKE